MSHKQFGPGLIGQLARTPLVDLARGHISGPADVQGMAAEAQLPSTLATLVVRTVNGTRLRHHERHMIARELIAQLQDSLAAGATAEQLAGRFGDPAELALLVRWACLARRSRPRRVFRRMVQFGGAGFLLLVLTLAFLVGRYVLGRPTISRDYLAEINRAGQAVPEAQRAWPLYRAALLQLEHFPDNDAELSEQAYLNSWPQIAGYLKRNRTAFDLARGATERPRLGLKYDDAADEPWLSTLSQYQQTQGSADTPAALATPHLDELARLRRLLLADSRRAVAANEGRTLVANLQTLLGMAEHLREGSPSIMTELRAFSCYGTSLQLVGMTLKEQPALLADEELVDLAHRIAGFSGGGTLRASLQGEQLLFEDLLQRVFTDDGSGDGRLTVEGYRLWQRIDDDLPPEYEQTPGAWERGIDVLRGAALSLLTASRKENSALAERVLLRFQAERAGALWRWEASTAEAMVQELVDSPAGALRYWPVLTLFPGLRHVALQGEILTQQRDATLAVIGLQLYQRRQGAWPTTLEQLTPFPLPAVPLDRFTGQPLRYRLVDGQPLLYSMGMDRDDDGGRAHRMGNELAQRWEPWVKVSAPPRLVNDGYGNQVLLPPKFDWDWILWPPPESPREIKVSPDGDSTEGVKK